MAESVRVTLGRRSVSQGVYLAILRSWLRHELLQLAAASMCIELFRRRHDMVLSRSVFSSQ
jgi:hypothetical protein